MSYTDGGIPRQCNPGEIFTPNGNFCLDGQPGIEKDLSPAEVDKALKKLLGRGELPQDTTSLIQAFNRTVNNNDNSNLTNVTLYKALTNLKLQDKVRATLERIISGNPISYKPGENRSLNYNEATKYIKWFLGLPADFHLSEKQVTWYAQQINQQVSGLAFNDLTTQTVDKLSQNYKLSHKVKTFLTSGPTSLKANQPNRSLTFSESKQYLTWLLQASSGFNGQLTDATVNRLVPRLNQALGNPAFRDLNTDLIKELAYNPTTRIQAAELMALYIKEAAINFTAFEPSASSQVDNSLYSPKELAMFDLVAQDAAGGKINPILDLFRQGKFNIAVPFTTDENNQITGYKVILLVGHHREEICEFRLVNQPDSKEKDVFFAQLSKSRLSKEVVSYVQRLLRGVPGGLSNINYREGVFCDNTARALFSYLNARNLFNRPDWQKTQKILFGGIDSQGNRFKGKIQRAQETLDAYQKIIQEGQIKDPKLLGKIAEKAVTLMYDVVSIAENYSYQVREENLSAEEKAFLNKARQKADEFRNKSLSVLKDILGHNGQPGYIARDINNTKVFEKRYYLKPKSRKHKFNLVDRWTTLEKRFARYTKLAEGNIDLWKRCGQELENYNQLVGTLISDHPTVKKEDPQKVLQYWKRALNELEGAKVNTKNPAIVRRRYALAAEIADELKDHPAREVLVSFFSQMVKTKKLEKFDTALNRFEALLGSIALNQQNFELFGTYSYQRQKVAERGGDPSNLPIYDTETTVASSVLSKLCGRDKELSGMVYNLMATLYEEKLVYRATKGKDFSYHEVAQLAHQTLKRLKDAKLTPRIRRQVIKHLGMTTENAEQNAQILADSMERDLNRISINNTTLNRSNGQRIQDLKTFNPANVMKLDPRTIRAMEDDFAKLSTVKGAVSGKDIKKGNPTRFKKANLSENKFYYVSSFRITELSSEQVEKVGKKPLDLTGGVVHKKDPVEFAKTERLASILLAMSRYCETSSQESLILNGTVVASMDGQDLYSVDASGKLDRGVAYVFGEGKYYLFRPTSLRLSPIEAGIFERLTKSSRLLTEDQRKTLSLVVKGEKLTKDQFFTAKSLTEFFKQAEHLKAELLETWEIPVFNSALRKLDKALSEMLHKEGLSEKQQETLKQMAALLSKYGLKIEDPRFAKKTLSTADLKTWAAKVPENKREEFVKEFSKFCTLYETTVEILDGLAQDLFLLAAKYPVQHEGSEGVLDAYWQYGIKELPHHATTTVKAPGAQDMLMTGMDQMRAFRINAALMPHLAGDLKTLQDAIEGHKQLIAQATKKSINPKIAFLKETITGNKPGQGVESYAQKVAKGKQARYIKSLASTLVTLTQELRSSLDEDNAGQIIAKADMLLKGYLKLQAKLQRRLKAENGKSEELKEASPYRVPILEKLLVSVETTVEQLKVIADKAEELKPTLMEKYEWEAARDDLVDSLTTDRLDAQKYLVLRQNLPTLLEKSWQEKSGKEKAMAPVDKFSLWIGQALMHQSSTILGPDGKETFKTAREILDNYFGVVVVDGKAQLDPNRKTRTMSLSNLTINPGQPDKGKKLAKLAIAFINENLPEESGLNLMSSLPILTASLIGAPAEGVFTIPNALAFADRAAGSPSFTETFATASNLEDFRQTLQNPRRLTAYRLQMWLSGAADRHPRMNLAMSLHMTMSASVYQGTKYLRRKFTEVKAQPNVDAINRVRNQDIKDFFQYMRMEFLPLVRGLKTAEGKKIQDTTTQSERQAKIQSMIVTLQRRTGIWTQNLTADNFESWLNNLEQRVLAKDLDGKPIFDAMHTNDPTVKAFAGLLEDVSLISEQINRTMKLAGDIENMAMTDYSPVASVTNKWFKYNNDQSVYNLAPKQIKVLHKIDGQENIDQASFLATTADDTSSWLQIYGNRLVADAWQTVTETENFTDRFTNHLVGFGKGIAGFFVTFGMTMGTQIKAGFADMAGGVGKMVHAGIKQDKVAFMKAFEQFMKGLSETAGSFVVFESIPQMFYAEVKNDIENAKYGQAIGKCLAIMKMTKNSFEQLVRVTHHAYRNGGVALKRIGLVIHPKYRAEMQAVVAKEARKIADFRFSKLQGGTGFKVAWYASPAGWVHGTGKMVAFTVKSSSSNISLKVKESGFAIGADQPGQFQVKLRDHFTSLTTLRHHKMSWHAPRLAWEGIRTGIRSLLDLPRKTSATNPGPVLEKQNLLRRAAANPYGEFELEISDPRKTKVGKVGEFEGLRPKSKIIVTGETLLKLARGGYGRTLLEVIKANGLNHAFKMENGSVRDLAKHIEAELGQAYDVLTEADKNSLKETLKQAKAAGRAKGSLTPEAVLKAATAGKGLQANVNITVEGVTYKMKTWQVIEILANRGNPPAWCDPKVAQAVVEGFSSRVNPHDFGKMLQTAQKLALEAHKSATDKVLRARYGKKLYSQFKGFLNGDNITEQQVAQARRVLADLQNIVKTAHTKGHSQQAQCREWLDQNLRKTIGAKAGTDQAAIERTILGMDAKQISRQNYFKFSGIIVGLLTMAGVSSLFKKIDPEMSAGLHFVASFAVGHAANIAYEKVVGGIALEGKGVKDSITSAYKTVTSWDSWKQGIKGLASPEFGRGMIYGLLAGHTMEALGWNESRPVTSFGIQALASFAPQLRPLVAERLLTSAGTWASRGAQLAKGGYNVQAWLANRLSNAYAMPGATLGKLAPGNLAEAIGGRASALFVADMTSLSLSWGVKRFGYGINSYMDTKLDQAYNRYALLNDTSNGAEFFMDCGFNFPAVGRLAKFAYMASQHDNTLMVESMRQSLEPDYQAYKATFRILNSRLSSLVFAEVNKKYKGDFSVLSNKDSLKTIVTKCLDQLTKDPMIEKHLRVVTELNEAMGQFWSSPSVFAQNLLSYLEAKRSGTSVAAQTVEQMLPAVLSGEVTKLTRATHNGKYQEVLVPLGFTLKQADKYVAKQKSVEKFRSVILKYSKTGKYSKAAVKDGYIKDGKINTGHKSYQAAMGLLMIDMQSQFDQSALVKQAH